MSPRSAASTPVATGALVADCVLRRARAVLRVAPAVLTGEVAGKSLTRLSGHSNLAHTLTSNYVDVLHDRRDAPTSEHKAVLAAVDHNGPAPGTSPAHSSGGSVRKTKPFSQVLAGRDPVATRRLPSTV